jgi:hypothetical protein
MVVACVADQLLYFRQSASAVPSLRREWLGIEICFIQGIKRDIRLNDKHWFFRLESVPWPGVQARAFAQTNSIL